MRAITDNKLIKSNKNNEYVYVVFIFLFLRLKKNLIRPKNTYIFMSSLNAYSVC